MTQCIQRPTVPTPSQSGAPAGSSFGAPVFELDTEVDTHAFARIVMTNSHPLEPRSILPPIPFSPSSKSPATSISTPATAPFPSFPVPASPQSHPCASLTTSPTTFTPPTPTLYFESPAPPPDPSLEALCLDPEGELTSVASVAATSTTATTTGAVMGEPTIHSMNANVTPTSNAHAQPLLVSQGLSVSSTPASTIHTSATSTGGADTPGQISIAFSPHQLTRLATPVEPLLLGPSLAMETPGMGAGSMLKHACKIYNSTTKPAPSMWQNGVNGTKQTSQQARKRKLAPSASHNGKPPAHAGRRFCHICRSPKDLAKIVGCCSGKQSHVFCSSCVQRRLGLNFDELVKASDWLCPKCEDRCPCSKCRKRPQKGLE